MIGKVVKAHGLKGLLKVVSYAQSGETFHNSDAVYLRKEEWGKAREFKLLSVTDHKSTVLLALEGVPSIEAAERLRGAEVLIDKGSLFREEDEYFWYELIDLKVFLDTGTYLGDVHSIISEGGNDIYIVKNGDRDLPVPATHEVVRKIDLEAGTMTVRLLEGMLDLNEV